MGRIVAATLLLAGCAAPPPARVAGEHPTIVSLNPCTDAILAEVADPAQLLAISHYSHDPRGTSMPLAAARRFRATGGTVEEVLALDPDVVVASSFLAPATRAAFTRLGVRVETVGIAATVAESEAQVRRLAAVAGHPQRGAALVERIEAALTAAHTEAPPVRAVLWQAGGIVAGEGTLASDLLRRTGFTSHSAARGLGQGDALSLERVLADPPQVLLVTGSERGQRHPALARLRSVRVERLDPALTYCGGPTIVRAAQRLAEVRKAIIPGTGRGTTRRVVEGRQAPTQCLADVPLHPALRARSPSPCRGGPA